MTRLLATLLLTASLGLPLAAQADEAADKLTQAKALVQKTVIKNLETGFNVALEKTVAPMKDEKADAIRKEIRAEFEKQREIMVDGLAKEYASKFSLDELKHINNIYDDKTYQKFQALNADPSSTVTTISQNAVTKLINMLTVAAAGENQGAPAGMPMPEK